MSFAAIAARVRAGERLDLDDGVALFRHENLPELGTLANEVRERLHGRRTWFNVNTHLEATNVCEASCAFCAFARLEEGKPGAYTMTLEEIFARVDALAPEVTEIHIVNGLNPNLPFSYYEDLLRGIRARRPALHLKCFTAVEIEYFAVKFGLSREAVLDRLIAAGLGSLPGGGAEIFADRVRKKICHDKVDADGWLAIHGLAHAKGLKTNCTMLYGHVETEEERVDHILRLRAQQDASGGFQCFVPLAFHPANSQLAKLSPPTAVDDLRVFAVSRLLLDNVPHLKAYWTMLGQKTAQTALWFGADDLDGTVEEERIYHMAGARTPQALSRAELVRLVRAAGREPVERDTLYRIVREEPPEPSFRPGRLRVVTTEQPL